MIKASMSLFIGFFVVICFALAGSALAQDIKGDRKLIRAKDSTAYQLRGNTDQSSKRYEGFYLTDVSSIGGLEVVSLTYGHHDYSFDATTVLKIVTPDISAKTSDPIQIRAVSIPTKTNYRMDAVSKSNDSITWPVENAFKANLTPDKIGVYGWIEDKSKITYVPVRVAPQEGRPPSGNEPLILTIRSNVFVKDIKYSIFDVKEKSIVLTDSIIAKLTSPGKPIEIIIPDSLSSELIVTVRAREFKRNNWLPVLTVEMMRP